MTLTSELAALKLWITQLPTVAMRALGRSGQPVFVLDFIMVGAVKRTMSLASGLNAMVEAKNMVCARALLRLQIDTLSRLRAYTYVKDPEALARAVMQGSKLNKHKSLDGKHLRDDYLVQRLSEEFSWLSETYKQTSGYVHFSEKQFFDTLQSISSGNHDTVNLTVSVTDDKYPESSWTEVVACFNELTAAVTATVDAYSERKDAA